MRWILISIITFACLTASAGYKRIWLPTFPHKEMHVKIVEYTNWVELQSQYWVASGDVKRTVYAWSKWNDKGWCEIHAMRVTQDNWEAQVELRGHELTHCTHGEWHD